MSKSRFVFGGLEGSVRELVAAEDMEFEAGSAKPLKVKPVSIPANTLVNMAPSSPNELGQVVAFGEDMSLPIERKRSADYCLFVAWKSGVVREGDLVGKFECIPIKPVSRRSPYVRDESRR